MTFNREPASWIGLIGAIGTVLVASNVPGLNAGQWAAILALITAVIMAAVTRPIAPAVFTGIAAALFAVLAQYGLHFSDVLTGSITALILAITAVVGVRPQVTPVAGLARR